MADDRHEPPPSDPDRPGAMMPAGDVAGSENRGPPPPYVPADQSPAEATFKAVTAGILFGILFGAKLRSQWHSKTQI